jgi:hypothetical protein
MRGTWERRVNLREVNLGLEVPGRLYLADLPGRDGSLDADLREFDSAGVTRIVCLAMPAELRQLAPEYGLAFSQQTLGPVVDHWPIRDHWVPERADFAAMIPRIAEILRAGEHVVVHCVHGMGRTGTVAIGILLTMGFGPEDAEAAVVAAGSCPTSPTQDALLDWYAQSVGS